MSTGLKHLIDWKAFVEYANDVDDIDKSIEKYKPNKKQGILIVFVDMLSKKT